MRWGTKRTDEFNEWWKTLSAFDKKQVASSIETLGAAGPNAGRPLVDTVKGSRYLNMKELRPTQTIRVFFAFDPRRKAVLLIGGDKAGKTKRFYRQMVSKADKIYDAHLRRIKEEACRNDA
ncbi:MAG TPA: type II toxin-antitoxin system RelE/ParE family toxin [Solirubrobacterales bacterium]|jgi:hypothetical protein|nr:type II toxin-antitoxin system RelE/ParE family toxin [Solirubrobacterales bacterium]